MTSQVSKVEELVKMLIISPQLISDDYGRIINKGVVFFNVRGAVRKLRSMGYKLKINYTNSIDWTIITTEPREIWTEAYQTIQDLKEK